jgi:adenosylcobinamide-GDP ribazoletransferase
VRRRDTVEDTVTVRALLGFFTALPLPGAPLAEAARRVYLLPLVGLVTGLPGALILFSGALSPGVAATLALGAVLLAAGLHHADGVLDVGDALMVQGSQGRRREVLKDARVGIGGLGALFLVYAPALAALAALSGSSPLRATLALLAAEAASRSAMTLILLFGRPAEEGSSAVPFVRALKGGSRRYAALLLALAIPSLVALLLGWDASLAALLTASVVVLSALWVANRAFGGIGGDVSGATGEMTRTVLLVALSGLL